MKQRKKQATKEDLLEEAFDLLDEVNKNIKLFKKTRQEVKKKYPQLFSSK
jgi:hypothetical protein